MERGYVHQHQKPASAPEPERAEQDLLLDRGEGRYVLVNAGDVIPSAIAGLPRIPRNTAQEPAGDKLMRKRGT